MFLSDILNVPFVVGKDIENNPKAQEELKNKIHNPNREIMVKDAVSGVTKFFKFDANNPTNNKEGISLKPVIPGMGDISSVMAPKPKLNVESIMNQFKDSFIGKEPSAAAVMNGLSVSENSSIVIPMMGGTDISYDCNVNKGTVSVNNGKIIYTAPSFSKVNNYSKYNDGDVIGQAVISINSIKPGFLKNSETITVNIMKLAMVSDNSIINDNLGQFMFDSKNLIGG